MKKYIKYFLLGFGITLFIGFPWIVVQLFAGISGGGSSSSSAPEGTAVLSTGETGGTKYLREDGDGTCSFQTPSAGSGDMLLGTAQIVTETKTFNSGKLVATTPSLTTPTITGTTTANGDITSTGAVTCDRVVATGAGTSTTTDLSVTYGFTTGTSTITNGEVVHGSKWESNFTIISPSDTYNVGGSSIPVISKLTKAITIDSIFVCLDSDPTTEILADLKSVTNPSGWTSPVLINSLNTASGQLTDTSITAGNVAAGTCIYLNFHAQPDDLTKFMGVTISGYYQ